ncbi:MAG: transcription elongation factor GreA [Thermodesulfobacteriota bacterium]
MTLDRRPISPLGFRRLQEEIDNLVRVERPKVTKEIEIALGHGDLSENAEYTYAKEKQGLIDCRIRDLQERLSACEVIDPADQPQPERVVFGCRVTLEEVDSGEKKIYKLLGPDETDVNNGIISVSSPLGKALIGKEIDDVVEVRTPGGVKEYEITNFER